jgi:hypothetical protein
MMVRDHGGERGYDALDVYVDVLFGVLPGRIEDAQDLADVARIAAEEAAGGQARCSPAERGGVRDGNVLGGRSPGMMWCGWEGVHDGPEKSTGREGEPHGSEEHEGAGGDAWVS